MSGAVRDSVAALAALGRLPTQSEAIADGELLERWERLLGLIAKPDQR